MIDSKYRCTRNGFKHAWKNNNASKDIYDDYYKYKTTSASNNDSPWHRPHRECINCGKVEALETVQKKITEWQDIKI